MEGTSEVFLTFGRQDVGYVVLAYGSFVVLQIVVRLCKRIADLLLVGLGESSVLKHPGHTIDDRLILFGELQACGDARVRTTQRWTYLDRLKKDLLGFG